MLEKLAEIPASFYTRDGSKLSPLAYAFLIIVCLGFFNGGFATLPPTDRDESSFAQATKQMIESSNYTDIRLQDQPRYKKPIGIYWLQSAAVRAFNPHHLNEIWAYRLPSALGATLAVIMTAALGTLLFGPATGLVAGMMLAGCVLLNVEARLAKTDAALLASITTALYALACAWRGKASPWLTPFIFWTAIAAGILIKGPIILLPIAGVLLWLKFTATPLTWLRTLRPITGLLYALLLIAPWFIAISMQSHGAFINQSAGHDMLAKLWQGQDRGGLPPGAHILALPILFFPFSLFLVLALPDIWKNRRQDTVKFCLGWIIPTWIVFELSLTKLPHYVLPTYPAIALLAAKFLLDGLPTAAHTARKFSVAIITSFWLLLGLGYAALFALLPQFTDHLWSPPQITAGLLLLLSQIAALLYLRQSKIASHVALTLGTMIFLSTTFSYTLPQLQHVWLSREIVAAARAAAHCPREQIISTGYHEPSLVFLAGTDTILTMNGHDAAEALRQDTCRIAAIDTAHQQEFLDSFPPDAPTPTVAATVNGLNSGHGKQSALTLYTIPQPKP